MEYALHVVAGPVATMHVGPFVVGRRGQAEERQGGGKAMARMIFRGVCG